MNDNVFVDTNVLIYAHDADAGVKQRKAASVIETLWENGNAVISTQVLQEFYVTVTRKIPNPLARATARGIIENYLYWQIEKNGPESILLASEIEERNKISFWDALIVAAAQTANAVKLLTEDLNHGQLIEGILVENPFLRS